MDAIRDLVIKAFAVDSIWSIVVRGGIWIVIALIIIVSVDNPNSDMSSKKLKANLGFFTMFLLLSGGLVYLLFGVSAK
jgi:hypothetical protein